MDNYTAHMLAFSNTVTYNQHFGNHQFHSHKQSASHAVDGYNDETRNMNSQRIYEHGFHMPPPQQESMRHLMGRHENGFHQQYQHMFLSQHNPWHELDSGLNFSGFQMPLSRNNKHKRPRMSLQKRLLVNARERERMRVLNMAFESLRDALPCYIADGHMAKITTLRMAINYIKALTDLLNDSKTNESKKKKISDLESNTREELISSFIDGDGKKDGIKQLIKHFDDRALNMKCQEKRT